MNNLLMKLSWDEPIEVQKKAIKLLQKEKDLSIFLQPISENISKEIWDNCALILCSKTNGELIPYISDLLEWLQDMNWPGAWEILERLQKVPKDSFQNEYEEAIKKAQQELKNWNEEEYMNSWLSNLKMINTGLKKKDFFEEN